MLAADTDVFAFEATAEWAEVGARYIIGIAALLSGDVAYAERLLIDVERRLVSGLGGQGPLRQISSRLPERFGLLYEAWLRHLIDRYSLTRDVAYVKKADDITDKLLARDPRNRPAKLMKAIAEFVLRQDIPAARKLLYGARLKGDVTWRYSIAFLDAYEGNLAAAETEYETACKGGPLTDVTVPNQCEEFIAGVLAEEPHQGQLHYCSALINLNAKKDLKGALRDFELFLRHDAAGRFPKQRNRAERLLQEVRGNLDETEA